MIEKEIEDSKTNKIVSEDSKFYLDLISFLKNELVSSQGNN
mgnify:CR=1 FL=1